MQTQLGDALFCSLAFQNVAIVATIGAIVFTYFWIRMYWRARTNVDKIPCGSQEMKGIEIDKPVNATREDKQLEAEAAAIKNSKVSVVLPVKGIHADTLVNWRSQVESSHGGKIEFLFVVESEDDPAYDAAVAFREEQGAHHVIKVITCGLSFYCSQKIHNLLEGVSQISEDSDFVLFLDDDATMRPESLKTLIRILNDPDVMVATGWPHDYLPPGEPARFSHFLLKGYRLLSYTSVATLDSIGVWGGCTLVRRKDLMDERVGILEAWQDCGYSDDMIIGGRCRKMGKKVQVPVAAMLPARMDAAYDFKRHWNFSRRQMFVCSTYSDVWDLMQNSFLLIAASFFGTVFGCFNFCALVVLSLASLLHTLLAGSLLERLHGHMACGYFPSSSPQALMLVVLAVASVWLVFMNLSYNAIAAVCERMGGIKGAYTPTQSPLYIIVMTFLGLAGQCLTLSSCAVLALLTSSIEWSGVKYVRGGGRVIQVWRFDENGKPFTRPWREAMVEAVARRKERL
eukprot:CAMPEP_0181312284 /NCGR_PEP_ID=MMETSP1101-20121128/13613_1 /TAXON_ID=46948 /ORGANISM="Rhodomonas abbreviata, Strain Caron Lab Isolate" /LENGTH=512 /DNA_ID=CAMNT_0023419121 /DNA_START=195 /DNA_END=1729 /DNA_ORIENTATION=+